MKKTYFKLIGMGIMIIPIMSLSSCGNSIDPTPDLNVDLNDKPDLYTYFPASGKSNDFFNNSFITGELEEFTGYSVTYNQTTDTGADTEIGNMLTGKDSVHMMKIAPTLFNNYVTQGYFTDLTEVIEKFGPNIKEHITDEQWEAATYDGKIYAIPEVGTIPMSNSAIVWNMDHLNEVGITEVPSTIEEFSTANTLLQDKYSENNANYHSFGLPGTHAEENPICAAFDTPKYFYENDEGEIENMIFSDEMADYLGYMNGLCNYGVLAQSWTTTSASQVLSNFVQENVSCAVVSYWYVEPLKEMLLATDSYSEREEVDELIDWNQFILGDGTNGSPVQDKPKIRASQGPSYYCTVPVACASQAAYVVDWIDKKMTDEGASIVTAGEEGTHFEYCDSSTEGAIKLGTTDDSGNDIYAKILDDYYDDIKGMSQYQTGFNEDVFEKWWPLSESAFNCWDVLVTDEEQWILNPFALHPVLEEYASIDLKASNQVLTSIQQVISPTNSATVEENIQTAQTLYSGLYWDEEVSTEVNTWYQSTKA